MAKQFQIPMSSLMVQDEVPTGSCNFSNVTFTTKFPCIPGSLRVYINNIRLSSITDYTASNTTTAGTTTITLAEAPHTDDVIFVDYWYKI